MWQFSNRSSLWKSPQQLLGTLAPGIAANVLCAANQISAIIRCDHRPQEPDALVVIAADFNVRPMFARFADIGREDWSISGKVIEQSKRRPSVVMLVDCQRIKADIKVLQILR